MGKAIPIISFVCQVAFFVAIYFAIVDLYAYETHWEPWEDPDPRMVIHIIGAKLFKMAILLIGGLLGALLSWVALCKLGERPRWFVNVSALLASLWLAVFPIGTVVGLLMFRWREPACPLHDAT